MTTTTLAIALGRLPASDRALLTALVASALATLALGVVFGATTGLVRAPGCSMPTPSAATAP